ncbi:MAG: CRISPR-associated endonuclease Cas3'', partial [Alicyclobacillus sp.]|nr:CRISPR-associated endonuclease Cas3'' [Alicyclobacillus sp.]
MRWLAHSQNTRGVCQPLAEHLTAVAELASEFVSAYQIPFAEEMAYLAGLYHDMGKYTSLAQKRLRGQLIRPVEHSGAGARHLFNRLEDSPTVSYILSLLILSHHSGLISMEHWQERMWKANPDEAAANCEVSADDVLAALSKAKEYITTDLYEPN